MPLPQIDILSLAAQIMSDPRLASAFMGQQGMPDVPQTAPPVAVPMPGQNAQAIVEGRFNGDPGIAKEMQGQMPGSSIFDQPIPTEQPGPDFSSTIGQVDPSLVSTLQSRAPSGQPTQGGAGFVDQIMGALRGAPGVSTATHDGGGFMGGLKGFAGDAMTGAAMADPSASPLSTFATAFSGASSSGQSRADRKRAEQFATQEAEWKQEDRTYQRTRDVAEDARDDRKMSIAERAAQRDERKGLIDELATAANIQHTQAETNKIEREYRRAGVSFDDMLKIENEVTDLMGKIIGDRPTDERVARAKAEGEALRAKLLSAAGTGEQAEPGSTIPKTSMGLSGEGTYDKPFDFSGSQDAEAEFEQLPIGSYYLNPADGVKLQKTH